MDTQTYTKDQHIAQLEATNRALADKLADLNKKQMQKHNLASLHWRNKFFYVKKQLEACKDVLLSYKEKHGKI